MYKRNGHFAEIHCIIVFQEFMTICTNLSDEQVKLAFLKFDTSGDDKLDYREFCQMIRQKENKNLFFHAFLLNTLEKKIDSFQRVGPTQSKHSVNT